MNKIYRGKWHFHELNKDFDGKLEYKNGNWTLCIDGFMMFTENIEMIKLITGKIDNEKITILNAELEYFKANERVISMMRYDCETIIRGVAFEKKEDIKFKKMYVEFKNLRNWSGFENIIIKKDSNNTFFVEKDNCQECLEEGNKSITFDFGKSMSLSSLFKEIEDIIKLFEIIYGEHLYICKRIDLETNSEILFNEYKEYEEIETPKEELIKYDEIKENMSNILNVYNQNKIKFLDILNILIELNNKKESMAIEIQFLLVVQGLESFSRRFRVFEENESLEDAIDQLCNNIKDENTASLIKDELLKIDETILRDRILVKEVSLSNRLRNLLKESSIASSLNSDKRGSLVHKIAKNRNYHTHLYELDDEGCIFNIDSFFYITRFLNLVLLELVLDELKLDKELFLEEIIINNEYIINKIINRDVY